MKNTLIILLLGLAACSTPWSEDYYQLVADFDENEKIYVVYVPNYSIVELISTLSHYEKVGVLVESQDKIASVQSVLANAEADTQHIHFEVFQGMDLWVRDSGPAILKNKDGKLKAVDFRSTVDDFESNDRTLASSLNLPVIDGKIMSVGGARESNGEGTVIMAESFFQSKNPNFKKKKIEKELKERCGVEKVIWLKRGLIEDELFVNGPVHDDIYPVGCGGHIDEFCRFVNPNTVLLSQVDPVDFNKHPMYVTNHQRMEENYKILSGKENKNLKVIRIPAAEFMYQETVNPADNKPYKVVLTASYLNFVIGNNVILAAKYFEDGMSPSVKEKDEKVRAILEEQFPNHKVIQINPQHLNARGGGYHCMTFNVPAPKKRLKRMS